MSAITVLIREYCAVDTATNSTAPMPERYRAEAMQTSGTVHWCDRAVRGARCNGLMDHDTARQIADSIDIHERELPELNENQSGQVVAQPAGDGAWGVVVVRRQGLSIDERVTFEEWARQRVYMLALTDDPHGDGWFRRKSDAGWQITARAVEGIIDPFVNPTAG